MLNIILVSIKLDMEELNQKTPNLSNLLINFNHSKIIYKFINWLSSKVYFEYHCEFLNSYSFI